MIDLGAVADEGVFEPSALADYLTSKIKVNGGKAGDLNNQVSVEPEANTVVVTAKPAANFSKRSLKYWTKKALSKEQLRDYIRVVASGKNSYVLKYLSVAAAETEEATE